MAVFNARQRKIVTSVALGCWLLAFVVGVIHACGLDEAIGHTHQGVTVSTGSQGGDADAEPGCDQFCANDIPLLAKPQPGQDQPMAPAVLPHFLGEPLLVRTSSVPPSLQRQHPPPDVALIIRFVRLAL
jgi:hypothetical protein